MMLNTSPSIFISAGDPSGDIAGSHLITELKNKMPDLRFNGLGGRRMSRAGQKQLIDGDRLAVLGFWEVARKFLFFGRLLNDAAEEIRRNKPAAVVLIDYPGFNLRLAEKIKPLGIPIIYYVSPQIWAWGGKRIEAIRRLIDMMLVILPFEKELYERAGVPCRFVGHYLLDDFESSFIRAPYNSDSKNLVLLPGSRPQEVQRMLPTLLKTAAILARNNEMKVAVAAVEGHIPYQEFVAASGFEAEIVYGQTRRLIHDSRLVLVSSGTATLEVGIIGRPMIVLYKTGYLTYRIARHLVKVDKIALINLVGGEKIVPELIQEEANPAEIAAQAKRFWDNPALSLEIVDKLHKTASLLGEPGAAKKAAAAILETAKC